MENLNGADIAKAVCDHVSSSQGIDTVMGVRRILTRCMVDDPQQQPPQPRRRRQELLDTVAVHVPAGTKEMAMLSYLLT